MNILLLNGLPEEYDGAALSADFRNMIQVEQVMRDDDLTDTQKMIASLNLLYPEIPADAEKAVKGLIWFFTRGKDDAEEDSKNGNSASKSFDFDQDAEKIFAAFYATYGISLSTIDYLHWWEFMALLEGLPEKTLIKRVMYWRTADLSKLHKEERKHVQAMRRLFALKQASKKLGSIEEVNKRTLDRVADRFAAAQRALKNKK
ncbi:MAG: bacteriophage Gp15 family protein [Clostridiales bacterium]|nr:bacteriophage Gp15 family protein [Clostridiales bacterium]